MCNKVNMNSISCAFGIQDMFQDIYYPISNRIPNEIDEVLKSRNGDVKELLNFRTTINKPIYRCVGGNGRDINIFFLLAEAIWIWLGRNDVKFLQTFNSKMADYSDDNITFHAPYGFRLRKFNVPSESIKPSNTQHVIGFDQLEVILNMLHKDPTTRRAVAQIWNTAYDLNVDSKDIPCNDLIMFSIRDNKLNLTIQNRSNDLHWGLPTNVFQFSFIGEIMSEILGIGLGVQTHNSHSLHLYLDNPITSRLSSKFDTERLLYPRVQPSKMNIDFSAFDKDAISLKMYKVDCILGEVVKGLEELAKDEIDFRVLINLNINNDYFREVFDILSVYIIYKNQEPTEISRQVAVEMLLNHYNNHRTNIPCEDYYILALNWFFKRIKDEDFKNEILKSLPNKNFNIDLGKL